LDADDYHRCREDREPGLGKLAETSFGPRKTMARPKIIPRRISTAPTSRPCSSRKRAKIVEQPVLFAQEIDAVRPGGEVPTPTTCEPTISSSATAIIV
jgi:hypothetical protein